MVEASFSRRELSIDCVIVCSRADIELSAILKWNRCDCESTRVADFHAALETKRRTHSCLMSGFLSRVLSHTIGFDFTG